MKISNWPTLLVLLFLFVAITMGWQWVWGVFFLFWGIDGIRKEASYIIEPVRKKDNPVVFWILIGSWFGLSLYSFSVLLV